MTVGGTSAAAGSPIVGLGADVSKVGAYNRSGATLVAGDLAIVDTAHDRSITLTTTFGALNPVIVTMGGADGGIVAHAIGFEHWVRVLDAQAVTPGDTLVASSTARYATVDNAQPNGRAVLGVARTAKAAATSGLVLCAVGGKGSAGTGLQEAQSRSAPVATHAKTRYLGAYVSDDPGSGRSVVDLKRYNLWEFRSYVSGNPDSDSGDWSPAWAAMFAVIIAEQRGGYTGALIEIPAKTTDYYHSQNLDIEAPHHIKALGVAGNAPPGVRLTFAVGKGVNVWGYNSPSGVAAQGAVLEGFAVQSLGQQIGRHGLHVYTDCKLRGLHVSVFDVGIRVQTGLPNTNANDFTITDCVVTACRYGFHLSGGDTNTFTIAHCTTFVCTVRDVLDESFLGGTWFRCHSEGSTGPLSWEVVPIGLGSHVLDCYSECVGPSRFTSPSFVSGPGLWVGGFTDDSNVMYVANESRGIQFVGKGSPSTHPGAGPYTLRRQVGQSFAINQPYIYRESVTGPSADPFEWYRTYDFAYGYRHTWGENYGGGNSSDARQRATDSTVVEAWPMQLNFGAAFPFDIFPRGLWINANRIEMPAPGTSAADPTARTWNPGDIWLHTDPAAAGYVGRVCTVMGTQGTYSEGRTAQAFGTTSITLSSASAVLVVGQVISVAGGTRRRILSISGTTVVLSDVVGVGGPGLSIAYVAATFKRFGILEA